MSAPSTDPPAPPQADGDAAVSQRSLGSAAGNLPEVADGRPVIAIFGSYSPRSGEPLYESAYEIGHALASAGYAVCNGGYDGTMAASAKGAKAAGGFTLGVTCPVFSDYRGEALRPNRWIDREIPACDLYTRIDTMISVSAGFVVLDGGTGTLAEFAIVWEFVCKKLIEPRPIFVVGEFWLPLVERVCDVRPKSRRHLHCVDSVGQIIDGLREYVLR